MRTPSHNALWKAQLSFWPESEEISPQEMIKWAEKAPSLLDRLWRYQTIATTIQYPNGIFYRTKPKDGFVGYRYGLKNYEYISGFTSIGDKSELCQRP